MRVMWAALAVVLLALAACGSQGSSGSSSSHLTLPMAPSSHQGISMTALLTGRVAGRAEGGRACVWIGNGADRTVLLWPNGYLAEDKPLRVVNGSGRVVARVGSEVQLGGGGSPLGRTNAALQVCGSPTPTHAWIVAGTSPGG